MTLVTGDEKAVTQTRALLAEEVVGVAVKQGISTTAAIQLHPARAQALIREAAEKAVHTIGSARPFMIPGTATIELDFDYQSRADQAVLFTGVDRLVSAPLHSGPAAGSTSAISSGRS